MTYRYAVVGAGRQGTSAAYDLGRFGDAEHILLADADGQQAQRAASRLNRLLGVELAQPAHLDAGDIDAVARTLRDSGIHAFVSAVPYFYNLGLTRAAIQAGAGMTDLGGNSDIVLQQLELSPEAADRGVTIVPDCGQVPGMGTTLINYAMEQLDETHDVLMWDCGLPQHPEPPWNYRLTFSIEGLTNEYDGDCVFIRDGELTRVPALAELESLDFPEPIGRLEGFTTSGGLTTAAQTFQGKLRTLQNKTLRYPGHFAQLKVMQQLGLFEQDSVSWGENEVSPRSLLHALWEPQIRAEAGTRDFILIHILARGTRQGRPTDAIVELVHSFDEATGFTAMEQATGWHAAIMTEAIVMGEVPAGVVPVEKAMSGGDFVQEAAKRDFDVRHRLRPAEADGSPG